MAKGAVVARIVSEYSDKGTRAATKDFQKLGKDSHGLGKQFEDLGKKLAKAFAVVEIAKFAYSTIKTAEAVNGAFSKMNIAFANTGSILNSNSPAVQSAVDKMTSLAFTSADTADALARGATIFHSAGAAMNNMGLAADIARTSGMSLGDAMVLLGKAAEGKVAKPLAALGVVMPKVGTNAQKFKIITDQLTASLKGQAEAYAQTHPIEAMKAKFEELTNSLGQLLLPVFNAVVKFLDTMLIPIMVKFINFIRQNPKYIQPLANAWALIVNILAKVGVVVLRTGAHFAQVLSVIAQVVRGIGYITGSKELKDWGKSAADGLGNAAKGMTAAADKLDKFHMNAVKLKVTSPIVVKSLKDIAGQTALTATATGKLTAEQIKVLAALKDLKVTPTTSTDPIELEAARLNLLKQQNIEAQSGLDKLIANYEAMMSNNVAAQRYSDILGVISDNKISVEEVQILAAKWGISKEAVVQYIGKIFDIPQLMDPTEAARLGFKGMLDLLDQVIAKMKLVGAGSTSAATQTPFQQAVTAATNSNANKAKLAGVDILGGTFSGGSASSSGYNPLSGMLPTPGLTPYNPLSGMVASYGTSQFAANNASTTSSNAPSTAGTTTVNLNVDGHTIATAVLPSVTQGILQNQISGKSIVYSGFSV